MLSALARACLERNMSCALLDIRTLEKSLTLAEVYQLSRAFPEMGFTHRHRLAILHRYTGGENAQMFAMFAADNGWNVRAFDSYEDAIEWFSTNIPIEEDE
ncbi:MAG TPA: hypothetical protein PK402_12330 [Tepidisphaeraceae bacterium]|nr:hypothetical protein [Tepidisphaeraceae bacterium]